MAKPNNVVNSTKYDPNVVYTQKISTVYADWQWNSRYSPDDGNEITEETGYKGLVQSLATEAVVRSKSEGNEIYPSAGQRDPILLRPNPFYGKKGHPGSTYPLSVVSGFQRFKAITEIARGDQDVNLGAAGLDQSQVTKMHEKDPVIRAFIRNMTEAEARKENLGENMLRSSLSAPDIAFGVAELWKAMPEGTTANDVAVIIGRSQQYVSKLFRIYQGLEGVSLPAGALSKSQTTAISALDAWRKGTGKKLDNDAMLEVAEAKSPDGSALLPSQKAEKYISAIATTENKPKKKQGPGQWDQNACIDAEAFGVLLGNLERDGAIDILGIESKHCATVAQKYASKILSDKGTEDILDSIVVACAAGVRKGKRKEVAKAKEPVDEGNDTNGKAVHE